LNELKWGWITTSKRKGKRRASAKRAKTEGGGDRSGPTFQMNCGALRKGQKKLEREAKKCSIALG